MDAYENLLAGEIFHNTVAHWLAALAVLVVGLIVLRVAKSIVTLMSLPIAAPRQPALGRRLGSRS